MTTINSYIIDSNVLIDKYLLHPETAKAKVGPLLNKLAKREIKLFIEPAVMAEVLYILVVRENKNREEVVDKLLKEFLGLPYVITHCKKSLQEAMRIYRNNKKIDFVDAYIGCYSKNLNPNYPVITSNVSDFIVSRCQVIRPEDIE